MSSIVTSFFSDYYLNNKDEIFALIEFANLKNEDT